MSSPTAHNPQQEWHTPQRSIVTHERFINKKPWHEVYEDTKIPISTARDWCKAYNNDPSTGTRRRAHNDDYPEARGAPLLTSDAAVRETELILEAQDNDHPVETKALTREQLGYETGLDDHTDASRKFRNYPPRLSEPLTPPLDCFLKLSETSTEHLEEELKRYKLKASRAYNTLIQMSERLTRSIWSTPS